MPSDFIALWLSFLGQTTYKWSHLNEPPVEERTLYRLWLGVSCLALTLTLLYWFASLAPEAKTQVFSLLSTSTSPDAWLKGFYYTLQFTIWLILSPMAVGGLYSFRNLIGIGAPAIALALWALALFLPTWRDSLVIIAVLLTPTFVCPQLPKTPTAAQQGETKRS